MTQTEQRLKRVDNLMDASNRLWVAANWYTKQLNLLRKAATGTPSGSPADVRYHRLSKRWHREADRMVAEANAMMARSLQPA